MQVMKKKSLKKHKETLLSIIETETMLHSISDVDILLEQILTESRKVVQADAGSIYIAEDNQLFIHYAQNDTLQKNLPKGKKLPFVFFNFPINESTIAGYVASTKKAINEPDVYNIDPEKPYKFGKGSDETAKYRTVSILTIPLLAVSGRVLGVLQVLNAKDKKGNIRAFSTEDETYLNRFATNAGVALERAYLTRSMIMRMNKMAELRDPLETGMHVNRVANYSVEIYDRWAFLHNIPEDERNQYRDKLKIAALLHDVGKIAVSDAILKKNGKLSEEEYAQMQTHTWLGAKLFNPIETEIDKLSQDIALRHHENWNGSGYPGHICIETGKVLKTNPTTGKAQGLIGEEIPLGGRIVALADVYDALSSKRSYKEPWKEEDILALIKKERGLKFDPALVDAFFDVHSHILAIKARFVDVE
ncbi:GAF and HD-GYP domain-containing protein [Treponema phagedenis]|uniref:GAF and HD-GYP domain-containing protein n=1 Tax=Treponema phagedenis TaxID=162 RepID=UPI0001F63E8A|nr:HD domain-containing phosphohydrolase [Treponema phagedenis]EFW37885.1 HD domain protein [Treponema phagedenis F0421]TYT78607.1 HD domain-containing protein [Treponema phagedenis]